MLAALRAATNEMDEAEVTTGSRILFITPTLKGVPDDFSLATPACSNRVLEVRVLLRGGRLRTDIARGGVGRVLRSGEPSVSSALSQFCGSTTGFHLLETAKTGKIRIDGPGMTAACMSPGLKFYGDHMADSPDCGSQPKTETGAAGSMLSWVERWLSTPRLAPYLAACEGDTERALDLYEWNIDLGQVLMRDVAHFEVALRNAYDRVMRERWEGGHWLLDEGSPVLRPIVRVSKNKNLRDVNLVNRRAVCEARSNAHDRENPDQVVANLMLGFWVHLTDRSRERDLWIPYLHAAWPKGTDRNKLNRSLAAINRVRNRVAHNERLFNPLEGALSPTNADKDILTLLRALCPEAAERMYGGNETPVELFCQEHPAPANVRL